MIQSILNQPLKINNRSIGLKLIIICGLALLTTIPALFVNGLVEDRTSRALSVTKAISNYVGGPQTFLGPTLAIPYSIPAHSPAQSSTRGVYLVFPAQASANLKTITTERHRSLFRVPVYQADVKFDASFDLHGVPAADPQGAEFDWKRAEILVGVSDSRGALADATLTTDTADVTFNPSELAENISIGSGDNGRLNISLLGAKVLAHVRPDGSFHVAAALRFSGAERIAVLAYGKTTHLTAQGDWRNPGFDGGILPFTRSVSDTGFHAEWQVPFIARGVRAEGTSESITGLSATALGVSFIEVADAYQSVNRSLKYGLLIMVLVFLSYFVFEVTTGKQVHPAQYVLVGLSQIIFYLLLLSFAELAGFGLGS